MKIPRQKTGLPDDDIAIRHIKELPEITQLDALETCSRPGAVQPLGATGFRDVAWVGSSRFKSYYTPQSLPRLWLV